MLKFKYNYGGNMRNTLLEELTDLQLREKQLKRNLDLKYYDEEKRQYYFEQLELTQKEIKKIKFKLNVERELKNEKFREDI